LIIPSTTQKTSCLGSNSHNRKTITNMKSTTVIAGLLASVAIAQPHGHHHQHQKAKRDLVIVYETVTAYETEWIDDYATEFVTPTSTPAAVPTTTPAAQPVTTTTSSPNVGGQFIEATNVVAPLSSRAAAAQTPDVPPPAPSPSSTLVVADTPVSVAAAPAQSSAAPAGGSGAGGGKPSTGSGSLDGMMTYYAVGPGSCGYDDSGADNTKNIVAISTTYFHEIGGAGTSLGVDQPNNSMCDKTITVYAGDQSVDCVIRDSCPSCGKYDIDVSEKAFLALFGSLDAGKVKVSWTYNGSS
jgi:hypothetical protein